MLLNLIVVLIAFALLYAVRERVDLEPTPKLVATIAIVASVLGWLIIGAAPKDCSEVAPAVESSESV